MGLPTIISSLLQLLPSIILPYFVAAIIIRISLRKVANIFTETVSAEHKILLSKLYAGIWYIAATVFVLWELGARAEHLTLFLGLSATGIALALRDIIVSFLAVIAAVWIGKVSEHAKK